MKVNFGIIGFGFMGHVHEKTLASLDSANLVAVCDIDEEKMSDAITENVIRTTSFDELLKIDDINTVIISISNHVHKEVVIKAAKAGKNIICEKPAAMNVKEYDEMIAAVKDAGVMFTVHQQRRYDVDFRTAKEVYNQETLGNVYTIQSKLYGINGNMHDWHVFKKYGGGMLYDWGVHLIDQMLYMVDSKIKTIYADLRNVINEEVDDYFKILLKFENGITAEIELGTYFLADKPKWFERHWFIGGNKGTMYSDGFDPEGKIARTTRLLKNVPGKTTMTASGPTRSFGPPQDGVLITEDLPKVNVAHIMFFENYFKALEGKEELIVKIPEVRRVLAVMEAVRESAASGKSVDFE
ncbi:Gfo/Idh/MocA family protein [Clostridium saccharoperbutylacetonicum]|uniref:Gfo/Idh/MocA family protein n=1 Tax=Clostridium saccharoperbutylacetonicum TaxID=36745 RepID=UPI000983A857|nr:Gfo/Idh/MocA family oxidoreductase [Clostridium saccharoperbutylacetonicum]AQR97194.1 scyllo-inositol 2-dehydrogenase [Clostridium saccharoperbutylacetonicum]NSB33075.1 putative dehydrogenase [Clostridium saccharoperbutylacetonicum]